MRGKTARPSQGSLFMTMPTTFRRGASASALGGYVSGGRGDSVAVLGLRGCLQHLARYRTD